MQKYRKQILPFNKAVALCELYGIQDDRNL